MTIGIVVVAMAACGGSRATAPHSFDVATIVRATGDPAEIERMLVGSVTNGGLWFDNPGCAAQFGTPGEVTPDRFDAFARCLAGLHLQASPRVDELPDVVVLTYAPGFEIEARVIDDRSGPRLTWIGYESRTSEDALVPTISVAALEAHRLAGDRTGPIDAEVAKTLPPSSSWLKVCVDADGGVTVQPRDVSPGNAQHTFAEAASAWKFRPFVVRDRAIPVCAMVQLTHPADRLALTSAPLPVPVRPSRLAHPPLVVGPKVLASLLIAGKRTARPDADTMRAIVDSGRTRVRADFKICLDETGHIESIQPVRLSGVPPYDRLTISTLRGWVYKPYLVDGKPVAVCTTVWFSVSRNP